MALFLVGFGIENDIPGEWVLMEFLSDKWFEETKDTHGSAARNNVRNLQEWRINNPDKFLEVTLNNLSKHLEWRSQNPNYERDHARMMRERREQKERENPDLLVERMEKVHAHLETKWKCKKTGKISTSSGITKWQKNRGIEPIPENRIQLTFNETNV